MPALKTYEKAIEIINGIVEITKREQLQQGMYIFPDKDEKLAASGAICGGHKACLLGSAWLSAGVKPVISRDTLGTIIGAYLPALEDGSTERKKFLRNRPALKLALQTLDALADDKLPPKKRGPYRPDEYASPVRDFESQAEQFFEVTLKNKPQAAIRKEILALCQAAKRRLRSARRREHGE